MDSILERQRLLHEESERLELLISKELANTQKLKKERLKLEHRINRHLERIIECNTTLVKLYEDKEGYRRNEIDAILVNNDFTEFYRRLKDIKDGYRKNPDAPAEIMEIELKKINRIKEDEALTNMFTGEENYGRFLDLNEQYHLYRNLKCIKSKIVDYLKYLDIVGDFGLIDAQTKETRGYHEYLISLSGYLKAFISKTQPLLNMGILMDEIDAKVKQEWLSISANQVYCDACKLMKSTLCQPLILGRKYFSKQTLFDAHLTGKKHLKAAENKGSKTVEGDNKRELLELEISITKYLEAVAAERQETKAALERKLTLTLEEYTQRLEEMDEEENVQLKQNDEDDEEMKEKFYNPLKLPMGWDGKPIPYWLYKLHGLGIEFPCEICGNFVYMGRKAFEKHFQETRHATSMRNLGIPNTKHFQEITKIQDALDLWSKMQKEKKQEHDRAEAMEEFEDAYGNVFNKKTYEDLKRQGLL